MKKIIILLIVTFCMIGFAGRAIAQYSQQINATVKISICGNDVIEGGEDCEGANLNGKSCTTLGYSGGILSCDIACTFDTYACIPPTPTPTPTITPTPTQVTSFSNSGNSPSSSPTGEAQRTTTQLQSNSRIPEFFNSLVTNSRKTLPASMGFLDVRNIGKLLLSDISQIVRIWVDEWRFALRQQQQSNIAQNYKCDINRDKNCDIKDFSIMMYYFEE